ncbi:MAG: hypothetical protein UR23_C0028G0003 [Candidatus Roizmanbacteria bacterium GW2011_GWA2_32_13]|uniref:DUF3800 domain-containing protein n=1 Tax=Candidatus Roizmanbacteria bacterium GW2011_GWA2_32_13 TaxID=1618475 RepID=A0A0G0B9I6_9BACT|nr:MAG: hypothetical protein UR23_C0028G0003 [Candidatus Roizmanbacteria bacterium GW2011_GWA2_32_13]
MKATIFIDYSITPNDEMAICGIACLNESSIKKEIYKVYKEVLGLPDTFDLRSMKKFEKIGFHYSEDHPNVKEKYFELLSRLPIDSEIIVGKKLNFMNYLNNLILKFSQKYKGLQLSFIIEQSDYDKKIKEEITKNKWYKKILTIREKSNSSPLSIADYFAGVYKDWVNVLGQKSLKNKGKEELRLIKKAIIKKYYDKIKMKIRHTYFEQNSIHISRESRVKYNAGGGKSVGHELMPESARSFQFNLTSSAYTKIPFNKITSIQVLSKWLSVPIKFLNKIKTKGITNEYYEKILIPKKNSNKKREVFHVLDINLENAHKIIEES